MEDNLQVLCNVQSHDVKPDRAFDGDFSEIKSQRRRLEPQSGGVQQVTVEHNGKGESVSNTVGSIYIYSPGMVILGSGSAEKNMSGVSEEAIPLISKPQQESIPLPQELCESTEEELGLCVPVPATGK
ncbi:hypothetical protein DNTS_014017 [Danionella cerebrum]|uniref:Uncharacterized protein n=1 Tax=Danionella cerebrum TaxID=2873325 RepID=A0A553N5B9_9TELE|nr:hypothetical protein DNTS_014017 [Danionella translucida]